MRIGAIVYAYLGGLFSGVGGLLALNGLTSRETITFGAIAVACTVLSVLELRAAARRR